MYICVDIKNREQVDETRNVMTVNGDEVNEVEYFNCLGSFVQKYSGFNEDVKHRNMCGWIKWRETPGVLCD